MNQTTTIMKANSLILSCLIFFCSLANAQDTWKIDPVHSNVQFEVTHLVVSTVSGKFSEFSGSIVTAGDTFENAQVSAEVDVQSIDTENLTRDKHLKEDDFFNAEKFPKIKFQGEHFKRIGGKEYLLSGDLTIRDVTKKVSMKATHSGTISTGSKMISGFKVSFTINRFDYGLKWDDTLDSGSLVVGEDVDVKMNIELTKM